VVHSRAVTLKSVVQRCSVSRKGAKAQRSLLPSS
jgi:hypothetical protein